MTYFIQKIYDTLQDDLKEWIGIEDISDLRYTNKYKNIWNIFINIHRYYEFMTAVKGKYRIPSNREWGKSKAEFEWACCKL